MNSDEYNDLLEKIEALEVKINSKIGVYGVIIIVCSMVLGAIITKFILG